MTNLLKLPLVWLGLVLALLERIPSAGDRAQWQGLSIEVVDMDGRRIDKLLVTRA